ncbi:MAG: ATP-binding protein, partial [Bacteroidota bacterium]|nr:ATP-binding protein [Bacteroidota bacterium]
IVFCNRAAIYNFGAREEKDLMGNEIFSLFSKDSRSEHKKLLESLAEESTPDIGQMTELNAVCSDGSFFPVEVSASTWKTRQGRFFSFIIHDVTELKENAEALMENAKKLEASNAELEKFAYVASHDLKEPLRTISNFVQLLDRSGLEKNEETAEFMSYIVDGTRRMENLINDLLEYSRITRKTSDFNTTELNTIMEQTLRNLAGTISSSGAKVNYEKLPILKADTTQMGQLFQNLISNGIKFNQSGQPEINITCEDAGSKWQFRVSDNGIGIPEEYSDRIFNMFQRLHTENTYSGSGIGLAICKRIIENHGGTIWHETNDSGGADFVFDLPKDAV